jgi:uncharacterized protein
MTRPLPGDVVVDAIDQPFWDACRERRLLVYRCQTCGRCLWPAGGCPDHGFAAMEWTAANGRGQVHTWTVIHQQYGSSFSDEPAVVGVVELDEGALLHVPLVGFATDQLTVGAPVRVDFRDVYGEYMMPVFIPANSP